MYIGFIIQIVYIISRGVTLGRLPLVGPHDTLVFLASSIAAFSIPFGFGLKNRTRFFTTVAIMVSIFTAFAMTSTQHNSPLPPVLKTFWFECHVVLAFMSYALFGIAAILSGLYLKRERREVIEKVNGDNPPSLCKAAKGVCGYLEKNGEDKTLEGLKYRAVLIGYCLFTMSMIFGGVWAYLAWGTYWIWTPKELWTSILWIYYSLYLHARLRKWWMGKPMAYLGIIGFGVVMFTYLGVSLLMKSSHSF